MYPLQSVESKFAIKRYGIRDKMNPPFHVDVNEDCKTAEIFYMNSNNGYTLFENGDTIESVKNRVVIFPSQYMHTGVNTTDSKYRMVINVR